MLRFNVLSRKSTIINSKVAKIEEATDYLMDELDRIDSNLEKILQAHTQDAAENAETTDEEANAERTKANEDKDSETELLDPDAVIQKGRPRSQPQ